jgi:hypothetical protein
MRSILKNPILEVLYEIKITNILNQSNFIKKEVGYSQFQIILHFLYMLIMKKRESTFKLDFSIKLNDKHRKNISDELGMPIIARLANNRLI